MVGPVESRLSCTQPLVEIQPKHPSRRGRLLLFEHPDPVPIFGRWGFAELKHAGQHDAARRILRVDRKARLETADRLVPGAAAIGGERTGIGTAQFPLPGRHAALAAEQFEDALGLALAAHQHGIDLARLDAVAYRMPRRLADQRAHPITLARAV